MTRGCERSGRRVGGYEERSEKRKERGIFKKVGKLPNMKDMTL